MDLGPCKVVEGGRALPGCVFVQPNTWPWPLHLKHGEGGTTSLLRNLPASFQKSCHRLCSHFLPGHVQAAKSSPACHSPRGAPRPMSSSPFSVETRKADHLPHNSELLGPFTSPLASDTHQNPVTKVAPLIIALSYSSRTKMPGLE